MAKKHTYKKPRPLISTECVVFCYIDGELNVLLLERKSKSGKSTWVLPGGTMDIKESAAESINRHCKEKLGIKAKKYTELKTFSGVKRNPDERVVSIAFYTIVKHKPNLFSARNKEYRAEWFSQKRLPRLGFDHADIIKCAVIKLKEQLQHGLFITELIPDKFTITEIQHLNESILNKKLDKRNFRKRILANNILQPLKEKQKGVRHRAAKFYKLREQ